MTTYIHWRLETDDQGFTWAWFDHADASTNVLSSEALAEFGSIIEALHAGPPRGLVIASAKPRGFIAGADVKEFTRIEERAEALELMRTAHHHFHRLEQLPCPSVARISGFCLGGGLELALACRYRVALEDPGTRLGLPEILLGIHPGFGGSVRLIRRIGAPRAFEMMLSGRTLDPRTARRFGLVDHAVPERHLDRACRHLLETQPPPKRPAWWLRSIDSAPLRPLFARLLRRQVVKRAPPRHYPAPYALIDLWQHHGASSTAMFEAEAESVADLILSETSRNLVRVFFLRERLKRFGRQAQETFGQIQVVGAGVMGGDIAAWCSVQGLRVGIQDRAPEYIAPAVKRAWRLFARKFKRPHQQTAAKDRFIPDPKSLQVAGADVVIEAIIENLEAKQALFRELEPRLKSDALLATNTSSIPLEALAEALKRPERLVGLHFFNPVAKMQLVEVVRGEQTSEETAAKAAALAHRIDKLPLPVRSAPGFLVNRVLMPYLMEAVIMLEEGVAAEAIDQAATDFGMPMGPILLADTVGLDICLAVAEILSRQLGGEIPTLLREKVAANQLGRKTGKGFYAYKGGKPVRRKQVQSRLPAETIEERLILRLLNECVAVLREKVVEDADLVDAGMIFGTGFAPFRGGPMHYLQTLGADATREKLATLADRYGSRFEPDPGWEIRDLLD